MDARTLREEIVETIILSFAEGDNNFALTTMESPDGFETWIYVEGYPRPIRVEAARVAVPSEFEDDIRKGIELDVLTIIAEERGKI